MSDLFNTEWKPGKSKDEWLTPPDIIRALGDFDLDPCAPIKRPWDMAKKHYTRVDNGLLLPWEGRIWLNPPYGKETFRWMARLAEHKSGIALIYARTETNGFQDYVLGKADALFFFRGRLQFYHVSGKPGGMPPPAPSVLVSYSEEDTSAIERAGLDGKLVRITPAGREKCLI